MFSRILLLFLITPIVELGLLIKLGELVGFWPTMALIVTTAVAGSLLLKREGLTVWRRFNDRLNAGDLPGKELLDGVIVLVAAALLITPGVLTDVTGFIGLLPPTRALIRKAIMKRINKAVARGSIQMGFGAADWEQSDPADPPANGWAGSASEVPRHVGSLEGPEIDKEQPKAL